MSRFTAWLDRELTHEEREAMDRRFAILQHIGAVLVVVGMAGIAVMEGVRRWP